MNYYDQIIHFIFCSSSIDFLNHLTRLENHRILLTLYMIPTII